MAMVVLMWLPTRTFARLQINLKADSQPIFLNITGYEALMMANGLAVIPAKAAALVGELQSQEGGERLIAQYDIGERQQGYLRELAAWGESVPATLVPLQLAFFVLPAMVLLMAIIVALSRGYFGEQLIKGVALIGLTLAAVAVTAGAMLFLSERLDAVINASVAQNTAGFPGLGVPVNDTLPELRVGVLNLIDTRTPVIAGGVALIGAVVAMLGAALAARKPGLNPRQIAQAAMLQAQIANGMPITPSPQAVSAGLVQPTQRLNQNSTPTPPPAPAVAPRASQSPMSSPPSPASAPPASPATASPGGRRVCPTCGQPILGTEKFCRSCGARLPAA